MLTGVNHLAFITNDMDKTIRFYRDLLELPLVAGVAHSGFRHYFFRISDEDSIAFFSYDEAAPMRHKRHGVKTSEPVGFDHVSLGIGSKAELFALRDRLEAAGFEVSGPIDHGFIWSIYFFDPNGIPLEVSWQYLTFDEPPVLADDDPTPAALEGSTPQPGYWPRVTQPTPPEQWHARAGGGYEIRDVALRQGRGHERKDAVPTDEASSSRTV